MARMDEAPTPDILYTETANASIVTPASGNQKLFVDTDHILKLKNSSGTVTSLAPGMANPLTTTGDLIYSSSGTTAARLGIGSSGQVVTVAGGVPTWATPTASAAYGQTYSYPTTFTGDTYGAGLNAAVTDVSAFSTRDLLNSRVMHLQTLGASKDQRVRLTLGTTKAGAFDVATAVAINGLYWATALDTYLEVRGSTSADAQLFLARIYVLIDSATGTAYNNTVRFGGSSTVASTNDAMQVPIASTFTLRFIRDGSNVITYFKGYGTAPLALGAVIKQSDDTPYTNTVSGTLARIEYSIHTPSGPGSTAQWDAYVDWLASV